MKTKVTKQGDDEARNDLVSLEEIDSEEFGRHIHDEEGQLTLDVYQTDTHLVVIAPVAGVEPDEIDITVSEKEVLTIRGTRQVAKEVMEDNYLCRECFWGAFSRSIVLPEGLDVDEVAATFKRGILKIEIPKLKKEKTKKVEIKKN
jgi:HSP20 family protein